jgi:hypothetical protein
VEPLRPGKWVITTWDSYYAVLRVSGASIGGAPFRLHIKIPGGPSYDTAPDIAVLR